KPADSAILKLAGRTSAEPSPLARELSAGVGGSVHDLLHIGEQVVARRLQLGRLVVDGPPVPPLEPQPGRRKLYRKGWTFLLELLEVHAGTHSPILQAGRRADDALLEHLHETNRSPAVRLENARKDRIGCAQVVARLEYPCFSIVGGHFIL